MYGELSSLYLLNAICQVRAIVVSAEAYVEAKSEEQMPATSSFKKSRLAARPSVSSGLTDEVIEKMTDEEVFLAQLFRRASLLNEAFQKRVLKVMDRREELQTERADRLTSAADIESKGQNCVLTDIVYLADGYQVTNSDFPGRLKSVVNSLDILTSEGHPSHSTEVPIVESRFIEGVGLVEIHPAAIKT